MTTAPVKTEDDQALEIVRLGFGDSQPDWNGGHRCLDFRVAFDSHRKACQAVRAIGGYNGFDPAKVCGALEKVAGVLDGFTTRVYFIGRESSPVIYVYCSHRDNPEAVKLALAEAEPDELSYDEPLVRAWWD